MSPVIIRNRWAGVLAALAFVAIGIVQSPGVLNGGFRWDESFGEYIPWRVEAARQLAAGHLPLFTDRVFGGMPLLATSYVGVFYSPNWLYIAFPPWISNWLAVLHTVLGGMGMYVYLRSRRMVPVVAFAGGLLFVGCYFFLSHMAHVSMREAGLLMPWLAWLGRRVLRVPSPARAAALAAGLALYISVGYQQMVLFAVMWIGVEWLAWLPPRRRWFAGTAWLALGGLLGVGIMACQIYPTMMMLPETARSEMKAEHWMEGSFPPSHMVTFFSPRALGVDGGRYAGHSYPGEIVVGLQPAGWGLALLAVALLLFQREFRRHPRGRQAMVSILAGAVFLVFAWGEFGGVYTHLFEVPPFSLFRIPARWLLLVNCMGIVAGAAALQWLMGAAGWRLRGMLWPAVMLCLGLGGLAALLLLPGGSAPAVDPQAAMELALRGGGVSHPRMEHFLGRFGIPGAGGLLDWTLVHPLLALFFAIYLCLYSRLPLLAAVLLVLLVSADTFIMSRHALFEPSSYADIVNRDEHPLTSHLEHDGVPRVYVVSADYRTPPALILPGMSYIYQGLSSLNGYCPLMNDQLGKTTGMNQIGLSFRDTEYLENPAMLRQMAVTHILLSRDHLGEQARLAFERNIGREYDIVAWQDGHHLLKLRGTRPRFDMARQWRTADPGELNDFIRWRDPSRDGSETILEDPAWRLLPETEVPLEDARVEVVRDDPSHQVVRVDAPGGGVLLVRDVYWPGWRYRIVEEHGRLHSMKRANGLIRYAPIPPGEWTVEMVYRAPGWRRGVAVSLASAALCLMLALSGILWRRRKTA